MTMLLRTTTIPVSNYMNGSLHTSGDARILSFARYDVVSPSEPTVLRDYYIVDTATGVERSLSQINPVYAGPDKSLLTLSADGRKIAFVHGGGEEIVVLDVASGRVEFASNAREYGEQNGQSTTPSLSADGRYLVFQSRDSNGLPDLFVRDLVNGVTTRITDGLSGLDLTFGRAYPQISGNGAVVVYANNGQLYAKNLATGALSLVSAASDGTPLPPNNSFGGEVSADGRYVMLYARNGAWSTEVLRKDLATGVLEKIDPFGPSGSPYAQVNPEISSDGQLVAFTERANPHSFPENNYYIKDMHTGEISSILDAPRPNPHTVATLSPDGSRFVSIDWLGGNGDYEIDIWRFLGDGSMAPGAGNHTIEGGSGLDSIVYGGKRAEYGVANGVITDSVVARNGTDTLLAVDRVHFDDSSVAFDFAGAGGQALRLYQAAFDRAPDLAGIGFWIGALDKGTTLREVAAGFVASNEFKAFLATVPTTTQLVQKLYENILGRPGEAAGIDFWTRALDSGDAEVADVLVGFSESFENVALVGYPAGGIAFMPVGAG